MPGYSGMVAAKPRRDTVRYKVWRSIRILRRFTIPDLVRTSGAKTSNTRRFVRGLVRHGYAVPVGTYVSGRTGSYQGYRLVRDTGPDHPTRCHHCGQPLGFACEVRDERSRNDQ